MKTCRSIRKKLSAYQDGEVTLVEEDSIDVHLRTCEACRKQHEALLQTDRMLRQILKSLPEIEPAPGLSRQIMDSATRAQESFWAGVLGEAFQLFRASAAIVPLAAAGLLIGTLLGNVLMEGQFHSAPSLSLSLSDQALTLSSMRAFDAFPPGSFAEAYLKLAFQSQEVNHEK
jgi:predicted anti-sigma-YlaC factor YlaD